MFCLRGGWGEPGSAISVCPLYFCVYVIVTIIAVIGLYNLYCVEIKYLNIGTK